MQGTQSRVEESTGDRTRVRPHTIVLGIDAEGARHIYRTHRETIHVVRVNGHRECRVDVSDRHVDDWMEHVAEVRGWARRDYGLDFVDMLRAGFDDV